MPKFQKGVTDNPGDLADLSGSITSGGTSQVLAPANSKRTYLLIQNISDETMWLNFGAAASADASSFKLVANGGFESPPHFIPNQSVNIIGATTGKKFVAKEG